MYKRTFLLLTFFVGILISGPHINNITILSVGDHGRDLYAFEQVYKGKLVYKDFWWVYGPLMPYFYGLFYFLLGFKISSVLVAKALLSVGAGVFFYLASSLIMSPAWAFLAATYFLLVQQDFFFTFNHLGAITLLLACLWCLFRYLYERHEKSAIAAIIICFGIGLVKINFGLSALVATFLSLSLIEISQLPKPKLTLTPSIKKFALFSAIAIGLWAGIYWMLLKDLTIYEIRQCMPYFGDDQPYHQTPLTTIPYYINQHIQTFYHNWLNVLTMVNNFVTPMGDLRNPFMLLLYSLLVSFSFLSNFIIHGSTLTVLYLSFKDFFKNRRHFWITFFIIWAFFILNFNEFIVSGVWYRTFWSQPFLSFFNFFMIATALSYAPKWIRIIVASLWIGFFSVMIFTSYASWPSLEKDEKQLSMPRGGVYVGNENEWVATVNATTYFLNNYLKPSDAFFAMPYDCIYYYLTGKESPTRQLIFFDHIKIPTQQEINVIKSLEEKRVNYIVMSNRIVASEPGLGIFGKTYCPLLYKYLTDNFAPIWKYGGNWKSEPGWGFNHGVIIFKRK